MNTILWVSQGFLAVLFLVHGVLYLAPPAPLRAMMEEMPFPRGLTLFVGVAEIAAAVGLIAPGLTGIAPVLVPLAAAGLVLVMAGAVVFHARRAEVPQTVVTLLFAVLAAFVVVGRSAVLPL